MQLCVIEEQHAVSRTRDKLQLVRTEDPKEHVERNCKSVNRQRAVHE